MLAFIINSLAVLIWIKILVRFDVKSKDKKSLKTFFIFFTGGMASLILALILYSIFPMIDEMYDKRLSVLAVNNLLVAGPIEEFSKFIVFVILSIKLKSIKEPRDGMLQAAAVGLGFAFVENFIYVRDYGLYVLYTRMVLCMPGHMLYSAIWGAFYSLLIYEKTRLAGLADYTFLAASLLLAVFFHGMYNLLLGAEWFSAGNVCAVLLIIITAFANRKIYREIIKDSPYSYFPYEEHKKAIDVIKRALFYNPESVTLNYRIGRYYIYAGNYIKAKYHLDRCVKLNPKNSHLKAMNCLAEKLHGKDGAVGNFENSLRKMNPDKKRQFKDTAARIIRDDEVKGRILEAIGEV